MKNKILISTITFLIILTGIAGYFGGVEALALYNQIWAEIQRAE